MPSARNQPGKRRILGGFGVEVKRLRVKLSRELDDLALVERVRAASEPVSDAQILEEKAPAAAILPRARHEAPFHVYLDVDREFVSSIVAAQVLVRQLSSGRAR
jgi:hypothetical protein